MINFNFEDFSPKSTPIDPNLKLLPNKGSPMSKLEYSRAIGCLMYAMISIRHDIAFVVGKLSRYISNLSAHHWKAVNRVFKCLKGTIDYGLTYSRYPYVLEGYSDASWNTNLKITLLQVVGYFLLEEDQFLGHPRKKLALLT